MFVKKGSFKKKVVSFFCAKVAKSWYTRSRLNKGAKMENLKKMAGIKAAEYVKDDMVVGLGTGSTAYYFVEEVGRRIKEEGLKITAVTTSSTTSEQARRLGIPLKSIDEVDEVDVTVDGADEVDTDFNGIKGGDFTELRAYMIAKLMWNPCQDADSLMLEFMEGYYGKAAPFMYQYQKLMQGALLCSGVDLWIYDSPISHKDGMLNERMIKTYNELFDKAEAAVSDDAVRLYHVQQSRLTLQYSELEIARTKPGNDRSALLDLFEQRTADFGVQTLNERNNKPADYCKLYRKRFLPQKEKSMAQGAKVTFLLPPEKKYAKLGETAITDGLFGGTTYVESWVGWKGEDASFIIDLGEEKTFRTITTDFLHQLGAWILLPKGGTYSVSTDGTTFMPFGNFEFAEDRDMQVKFVEGKAETPSAHDTLKSMSRHLDCAPTGTMVWDMKLGSSSTRWAYIKL
mgnify:CR=1 FL=1